MIGAAALTLVIGASNSERMVQAGFDMALSQRDDASATHATPTSGGVALAQSEDFWLRHGSEQAAVKPVAWKGSIARGDKLTISSSGSQSRTFEVIDASPLASATRLDMANTASDQLLAVLCRDTGQPDAPPVRIIISEGGALPASPEKAL